MGLPFGYSKCTRGGGGLPPHCPQWFNIRNPEPPPTPPEQATLPGGPAAPNWFNIRSPDSAVPNWFNTRSPAAAAPDGSAAANPLARKHLGLTAAFGEYLGIVGDGVHSGSARTDAADNNTDYYPVPLKQETLRPGTVYADPYGHVLMIVRRVPQSASAAGAILAVDGQPDGTVARKRFWRGNFLFAQDPALAIGRERDEQRAEAGEHDRVGEDPGREVRGVVDGRAVEGRAIVAREHRVEEDDQHDGHHDGEHHGARVAPRAAEVVHGLPQRELDVVHDAALAASPPVSSRNTSSRVGRLTSIDWSSTPDRSAHDVNA